MEPICVSGIDLSNLSEIIVTALFSGLVAAFTVVAAYKYGIKTSDRNWKREQAQREKEQRELFEYNLNIQRLDAMRETITRISRVTLTMNKFDDSIQIFHGCKNGIVSLLEVIEKIRHLFPYDYTKGLGAEILDTLKSQSNYIIPEVDKFEGAMSVPTDPGNHLIEYLDELVHSRNMLQHTAEELVKEYGEKHEFIYSDLP